jgi:hypothetical protein
MHGSSSPVGASKVSVLSIFYKHFCAHEQQKYTKMERNLKEALNLYFWRPQFIFHVRTPLRYYGCGLGESFLVLVEFMLTL